MLCAVETKLTTAVESLRTVSGFLIVVHTQVIDRVMTRGPDKRSTHLRYLIADIPIPPHLK